LLTRQKIDPVFEILWDLFAEGKHWRIAESAEITLQKLKDRGYRLAVLSNNDSRLRSVLNDHENHSPLRGTIYFI
jgi:FMN phosphatase YigB (HAD superfamily)